MDTLVEVEARLGDLLAREGEEGWASVAALLAEVDERQLWREREGCRSYSAWLRGFAQARGCSESLLWKYKQAGGFWGRLRSRGVDVPELAEAQASARVIATVEKIAGADEAKGAELARRVVSGELRERDLKQMWEATRKVSGARKSRHDRPREQGEGDAALTLALTSALAAQAESWIWGAETPGEAEARRRAEAPRQYLARDSVCVRCLTEFPVRVESGGKPRQVDLAAVVVENQTTADWMEVTLRGVEVKVSAHDLARDQKMADYGLFCDYMSIAVPTPLVEQAALAVPPEWGVLAYDPQAGRVSVVREPRRLDAPRREAALMTAIVKLARRV